MKREVHKKGRRKYGYFIEQDNGLKIYMALRSLGQIYREKEPSLSEAMRNGKACWAIDITTLMAARRKGCTVICIKTKNNGIYFTKLGKFFDTSRTKVLDYSAKGGSLQKTLPLTEFLHVDSQISL